ncbi:Calpain-7 [Acipenser ruthenus]|uniref:Calpain-7 n=1 Tax=Acipenser ruthenus TaxID=7906 RepID=A0A662YRT4_ACIRT|nr:Calpain-7 [Acipenser ruthenus]
MDSSALELDAVKFAKSAIFNDQNGKYNEAVFYYKEAAQALIYARMAGSKLENIQDKISEYLDRVDALHTAVQAQSIDPLKSKHQLDLERAHFLVTQAFDDDEKGNVEEAVELYTQAVELCIETANETSDQTLQLKLKQLARQALDRAEGLKDTLSKPAPKDRPASAKPGNPVRSFKPLGPDFSLQDKPQPVRPVQSCEPQGQKYTNEEIEVLRKTSRINGIEYVPFMSVDLKERFAFPMPFSDKFGKLALSPKQKAIFSRWVRPDEISNNPTMIYTVSSFSIKQTVVSDCSFVASLAISAAYERRYNKKLITSIIYPQNKNGQPEYNPCGKYMVKLHINGVPRKCIQQMAYNQLTILDDASIHGLVCELLCSAVTSGDKLIAVLDVLQGYQIQYQNSLLTFQDDFASNREFITLVVYKTDGKKVYYPSDPPPYIDGIRINSPHYLTKIKLTTAGTHTFSLVVSQYEKQNTIHYTLRVYSGCKCNFTKIPTPYTQYKRSNGQWKGQSAGGCGNYKETYKHNPIYQFQLEKPGPLLIELRGSRCGFCYMEVDFVPAGVYNIIPTTFLPNQEGPFFLDFNSTTPLQVSQLQ